MQLAPLCPAADVFVVGQMVDVQGASIGKGCRHHQASQNARSALARQQPFTHNVPGSIGMAQDPGRVFLVNA
jgi:large subunit ribosomal protein L3